MTCDRCCPRVGLSGKFLFIWWKLSGKLNFQSVLLMYPGKRKAPKKSFALWLSKLNLSKLCFHWCSVHWRWNCPPGTWRKSKVGRQLINLPTNQPNNQPTMQPIKQSMIQWINESMSQLVSQSVNHRSDQLNNLCVTMINARGDKVRIPYLPWILPLVLWHVKW